ncbi:MAG TPA: MFS transporter [Candidatus Limnocylindria bacterium]|nr:MFS transporter [Candidatus Limnocylindria bacterium]
MIRFRSLAGLARGFAALESHNFRLYWFGQGISRIGTWMQQISLPWLVLELGGSPIQLGIVAALEFVPSLVLAPFGGVFVDRLDKRRTLLVTQSLATVQVIVLLALTLAGAITIPLIMALSLALGVVNALDMPVRQALAADVVARPLLPNAIALNSMAFNGARVIGPALGGLIIALGVNLFGSTTGGIAFNFAVNAISYLAVLFSIWRMDPAQIRRVPREAQPARMLDSLREGVAFAWRSPTILWALVLLGLVATFGLNFRILLPLFAQDVLGLDADGYGFLYAATGFGSLIGAVSLAYMRQRRALALMLGGGLLFGLLVVGISQVTTLGLAVPLAIGAGLTSMLMINTVNATVQANVTDAVRGRVMALYVTVFAGTSPIGGIFAGAVAERWDSPTAFLLGGLISIAAVGLVAWRWHVASSRGQLGVTRIGESLEGDERPSDRTVTG